MPQIWMNSSSFLSFLAMCLLKYCWLNPAGIQQTSFIWKLLMKFEDRFDKEMTKYCWFQFLIDRRVQKHCNIPCDSDKCNLQQVPQIIILYSTIPVVNCIKGTLGWAGHFIIVTECWVPRKILDIMVEGKRRRGWPREGGPKRTQSANVRSCQR